MIDKAYWNKIASEWKKKDDGIERPKANTKGAKNIDPDEEKFGVIPDEEIEDILADLDSDEI